MKADPALTADSSIDDLFQAFERAAADFPRSDYRPSWLYWTARAYEALAKELLQGDGVAVS